MIEALARAKVNLALAVIGRRADGYHELVSVFARLDLADRLVVEPAEHGSASRGAATVGAWSGPDRLTVSGPIAYRPGPDDLALRAVGLLREALAPDAPGLALHLEKHIPLAAGLGGGSADAAAALSLAARAFGVTMTADERLALAARLGSDVPFLAADVDAALVTGRGEHVHALPGPTDQAGLLLVTTGGGLSTRDVFATRAELIGDGQVTGAAERARALAARLAAGCSAADLAAAASDVRDANDLWPPASRLRPDLASLRATLEARLERPVLLSGSGPTLLALYASRTAAAAAADALRARPPADVPHTAVRVAAFERSPSGEGA